MLLSKATIFILLTYIHIMQWFKVAKKSDIPIGKGKQFKINGIDVAVFNVNGKFYAIEAYCRHQDAPLVDGLLKGDVIECHMHRWHYNVTDGRLLDHLKGVRLNTYKVEVKGDDIYVFI